MKFIPDTIDFSEYAKNPVDADRILSPREFLDGVKESFQNKGLTGEKLPWSKTHNHVRLRENELSIWAGTNGSGKSMLLSMVVIDLVRQGKTCCIASMEMPPISTLHRLTIQAVGLSNPTPAFVEKAINWSGESLWIYNQPDTVQVERMKGVIRYCREELGVEHFVLDSLMKCGISPDDYGSQKIFVDWLATYARSSGLHIHLVCHSRKLQNENQLIDKFDIKGASEITDLADNVFTIWRNKPKEHALSQGLPWETGSLHKGQFYCDVLLKCDKARHGVWEGGIKLFFDKKSLQYRGGENEPARNYV